MNVELDEVVIQDVSDEALELAAENLDLCAFSVNSFPRFGC